MDELDEAMLRVIAGPERKSRVLSDDEKLIAAYHETGHALVSHFLPNADPVHKVSIISRGHALGYTITLPTEDKFMVKRRRSWTSWRWRSPGAWRRRSVSTTSPRVLPATCKGSLKQPGV